MTMSGGVSRISPSPQRQRALLRTDARSIVNERTKRERAEASCHGNDVGIRAMRDASRRASHPCRLLQNRNTNAPSSRGSSPNTELDCLHDVELVLVGRIATSFTRACSCGSSRCFRPCRDVRPIVDCRISLHPLFLATDLAQAASR